MADPWAEFRVGTPPQAAPQAQAMPQTQAAPKPPGVIYGAPKQPDPPTPFQVEDQQLQREAAARAAAKDARDMQKDAMGSESERTAGFLAQRLVKSMSQIGQKGQEDPASLSPTFGVEATRAVLGNTAANYITSDDRQTVRAAQLDILDAALTLGTGAAYNKEQLESYRESYFPQLGDGPQTVRDKNERLRALLIAARDKAGAAAPDIDAALKAFDPILQAGDNPQPDKPWTMADTVAQWGEELYDENGNPLGPDGGGAYDKAGNYVGLSGTITAHGPPKESSFLQGVGEGVANVGLNAASLLSQAMNPGEAVIDAINDKTGANLPTQQRKIQEMRGRLDSAIANSNYRSSGAGKTIGALVASLPTMAIPNPMAAGAVGGALMAENPRNPVDVGVSAATGAVFGKVADMGVNAYAARSAARAAAKADDAARVGALADAGQAEGVTVNKAMADPALENRVTGVDSSIVGGPRFQKGMREVEGQIEGRVGDLGRGGTALGEQERGMVLEDAASRMIEKTGKSAKVKYDRAEKLAGKAKVEAKQSLAEVDQMIAQLSETPGTNATEITFLKTLKADLTGKSDDATRIINERIAALGPEQSAERTFLEGLRGEVGGEGLTVGALRRMRTSMRKRISKGELTFGEDEARVLAIMDKAAEDIRVGLTAQGKPGAARAFDAADKAYRARQEYITGTIQKVIGKRNSNRSPEDVWRIFSNMARGKDAGGLRRFYASLEPDEAADVAATFAEELGKTTAGEFSVSHFLTQSEKLSDSALVTIFGKDGAQSVQNLRLLGEEVKRVTKVMNSRKSGTGVANDWRGWLTNLILGGGFGGAATGDLKTVAVGAMATGGAKAARDVFSAKALLSPKLTKWILSAPRTTSPKVIDAHFARLTALAATEPSLAPEIEFLKNYIMKAANDNTARIGNVAASPDQGPDQK